MKWLRKCSILGILLFIVAGVFAPYQSSAATQSEEIIITKWEVLWETSAKEWEEIATGNQPWQAINFEQGLPPIPEGTHSAWYRIDLPETPWGQPSLNINKLHGYDVEVVSSEGRTLYHSIRTYGLDQYRLLIPVPFQEGAQSLYIHIKTPSDRIGIQSSMVLGDYQSLFPKHVWGGLTDLLLISFLISVAIIMLICSIFLRRNHFSSMLTLAVLILSFGVLILGYSESITMILPGYQTALDTAFGIALIIIMLTLSLYFEKLVGAGPWGIIRRYRYFLIIYSILFGAYQLSGELVSNEFISLYIFSLNIYGLFLVIQLVLLLVISIAYSTKKNSDAISFIIGYAIFSLPLAGELIWFIIKRGQYDLIYWKWGILGFVLVMILMLGRKMKNTNRMIG
ncbi:hypothetical protein [Paenibacillus sp. UMB4589-SE434]|uniref:hypothetical protein n=1 Tax=Paenibacillus sp. UMB4589-SE434 TaxID=3046314 RepID=UPI00254DB9AD|nr:hypothetical protein [Paenibacillus sp. UMB4589-SE434]MDK8183230.1 hypothetical protein [Paenibacillus sp. UMB4589-SE434]